MNKVGKSRLVSFIVALLLSACCAQVEQVSDGGSSLMDAGDLPACLPLGGPSADYCTSSDDGHCITVSCACEGPQGPRAWSGTSPLVGHDLSECQSQ